MPSRTPAKLLLTRPEEDSRRFAAMLPEFGTVISPIMRIVPVAHDVARLYQAAGFVFTSGHAVKFAGSGRGRLAICVGARTAMAAREAGFRVREGAGCAGSLLPLIQSVDLPLIHPHGRHLAREMPVEGVVVYDQIALSLNADARALLEGRSPVIVPVFSPRSARLVSLQLNDFNAKIWVAAISQAAAEAWHGPIQRQEVAHIPAIEAMVAAVRRLAGMEQS